MTKINEKNRAFKALAAMLGVLLLASGANAAPLNTTQTESDIARAIREVTGRDARPEETNPSRFGLGYDDIKARVESRYYVCTDQSLSRAIVEVTGRAPRGMANQGECNSSLYAQASTYDELKASVQTVLVDRPFAVGTCRNAELTRAITEVKTEMTMVNVVPLGAGELGECNSYFYGSYANYEGLKNNVRNALANFQASGVKFDMSNDGTTRTRGGGCAWWDMGCEARRLLYWLGEQLNRPGTTFRYSNGTTAKNVGGGRVEVTDRYGRMVAAGGGNMVAAGGGNVTTTVNGRMVAAGGGNLVSPGGGN